MAGAQPTFGIDFGTTNTRVAWYDGARVRMVPFKTQSGQQLIQYPSAVAYQNGEPVAWGPEVATTKAGGALSGSLKWILGRKDAVEVHGGTRTPIEIVADFFRHLRRLVEESLRGQKLERAALTIPVHYPPEARLQLVAACKQANIEISNFFFEPIAAIYSNLIGNPIAGTTAVFDWGGGSLDIATIRILDGIALTRQIDGWHRGGNDFDRLICHQAVNDFLAHHPQDGFAGDLILNTTTAGRALRTRAEVAKIRLTKETQAAITISGFLGGADLEYKISRSDLADTIGPDVTSGITRLEHALQTSGVTPKTLARLFLSGGTCNIPFIAERLAQLIGGHKITGSLRLPEGLKHKAFSAGLDDISNATAIGAAFLAAHGAQPVFASSVGVRMADAGGDQFYPIFKAGETVSFQTKTEKFFLSDASKGVARLLICDQEDPVTQRGGRLLRVVPVPVDTKENWLEVHFTLDRHLILRVDAGGVRNLQRSTNSNPVVAWQQEPTWIHQLNLGFRLPEATSPTPAASVVKGA